MSPYHDVIFFYAHVYSADALLSISALQALSLQVGQNDEAILMIRLEALKCSIADSPQ